MEAGRGGRSARLGNFYTRTAPSAGRDHGRPSLDLPGQVAFRHPRAVEAPPSGQNSAAARVGWEPFVPQRALTKDTIVCVAQGYG